MWQDVEHGRRTAKNVYRMYNSDGVLLYVGMGHAITRAYLHRQDSPWFREVARIDIDHYDSREEAREAEIAQIQELHPKYNILNRNQDQS